MKKNRSEMDEVLAIATQKELAPGLLGELLGLIKSSLANNNARGFKYMMHYYGLGGEPGLTLEAIGTDIAGGLTRERVRQIIDGALAVLLRAESSVATLWPYRDTKARFDELLADSGKKFLRLSDFMSVDYFKGFGLDPKGFIAFLNDAGIRQVVYRGAHYIYPKSLDRREAIEFVQLENKKSRRTKTMDKMAKMAKTVTYVPLDTREFLLADAKHRGVALNRLYEKILAQFISKNPCKSSKDFEKTQSWRARKGKAEWSQVGIYIDKDIFEKVKVAAAMVKPEPISNMSYICQAFVCFSKGQIKI